MSLNDNITDISTVSTQTVTASSSVYYDTDNKIVAYFYKCGRLVYVTINAGKTKALSAGATIITVPAGYCPVRTVEVSDTTGNYRLHVSTSGKIATVSNLNAQSLIRMSVTYICASS